MPLIKAPPPDPLNKVKLLPDFVLFARAYFNIELTKQQIETIEAIAKGNLHKLRISRRRLGINTANMLISTYIQEGLKSDGRARLPQYLLPPKQKVKGVTIQGKVLALIKRPRGAFNFELSRISLKYTSTISELRKDGHEIIAERQYNTNGKASDTWRYYLIGD